MMKQIISKLTQELKKNIDKISKKVEISILPQLFNQP